MIKSSVDIFKANIDANRAFSYVQEIAKYHRIQASRGYRAAAKASKKILETRNVKTQIISYPANFNTYYFTQKQFKEWHCEEAYLDLISPFKCRLSDFLNDDMSIIQRSGPIDRRDKPIEIVYIDHTKDIKNIDIDTKGKLIFVEMGYDKYINFAIEQGALGIITVGMPEIKPIRTQNHLDKDVKDKCANLSYHLYKEELAGKLCGFILTPSLGENLKQSCLKLAEKGKYPQAVAYVKSKLYSGLIENVIAQIKGTTNEEILMVAHLCHPKSSVNDNASGVAAAIEAIATIDNLIEKGELPRPKRTIKLILVPEYTGTYAYLSENDKRLDEIKAGINLDMVGAKQGDKAGAFLVIGTPKAMPTFVTDLSDIILSEVKKECALASKGEFSSLFNAEMKKFMFGSDHYILSDPSISIPSIALTQWPDKMYHTSGDTIENIDPQMLYRSAVICAGYVLTLANLSVEDMTEIMNKTRVSIFSELTEISASKNRKVQRMDILKKYVMDVCESYIGFFTDSDKEEAKRIIDKEKSYYNKIFELSEVIEKSEEITPNNTKIPTRLFKAPLSMRGIISDMDTTQKVAYDTLKLTYNTVSGIDDFIVYAINGKDNISEIVKKIYFEADIENEDYVESFINLLVKLNLVEYIEQEKKDD